MNYLALGLVIIIIIILYYVYYYLSNNTLTAGLQKLNKLDAITYENLINPNSYTYSYEGWIYLSSPANGLRPIFYRKDDDDKYSNFEVDISGQELLVKAGIGGNGDTTTLKDIMSVTKNFPIQTWTYLVINVRNLKLFEAYINGKLVKTVNVGSGTTIIPSTNTSTLHIGNSSLVGYITKFSRNGNYIDAKTVWEKYLGGNGLGLSNIRSLLPYGLNMSISKGEDVQRVINVF